jgi:broad specificity phosphatase PhoE
MADRSGVKKAAIATAAVGALAAIVCIALAATGKFESGSSSSSSTSPAPAASSNLTRTCLDSSQPCTLAEYAKGPFGDVLLMRHALAPGGGDPDGFNLNDCKTQRNLDAQGRKQAIDVGNAMAAAFLANGVVMNADIFTSQWCRCLDTADLVSSALKNSNLATVGASTSFRVVQEWGLNSFYQPEHGFTQDRCIEQLESAILRPLSRSQQVTQEKLVQTLLVTHHVTVNAVTGNTVSSGGIRAYNTRTRQSREIILPSG